MQNIRIYTEADYNFFSDKIIRCCMEVHQELGPGLMKSIYEACAESVMKKAGLYVQRQVLLPITFKGEKLDGNLIIDVVVNDLILLEIKSVEAILPAHEAQLATYLKLSDKKLGLLINFNVASLKEGIRKKINGNLGSM